MSEPVISRRRLLCSAAVPAGGIAGIGVSRASAAAEAVARTNGGEFAAVAALAPGANRPTADSSSTPGQRAVVVRRRADPVLAVGAAWRHRPPGLPAYGQVVSIPAPVGASTWYVDLRVTDQAGESDRSGVTGGRPWVRDAIVYGVSPFAFGYRGFADVRAALGRLQDLGVKPCGCRRTSLDNPALSVASSLQHAIYLPRRIYAKVSRCPKRL